MEDINNLMYGTGIDDVSRVLEVKYANGNVKSVTYKSVMDHWKESEMPHEFLYFEAAFLKCVSRIGRSKNVSVEIDVKEIPENILNKVIEEIKKGDEHR